jgi:hypothetical protein
MSVRRGGVRSAKRGAYCTLGGVSLSVGSVTLSDGGLQDESAVVRL